MGQTIRLGIDVACRADHQASCADAAGEFLWSGWRFRTTPLDLERLWAKVPEGAEVTVVLEPTRNAWVPLAAVAPGAGRQGGDGPARAVGRPAELLQQAHQDRPPRLAGPGPAPAAAPRRPPPG